MAKIKIDDREYEIDSLPEQVRAELGMLQAVDQEIARLNVRLAIAQTARVAYARAINEGLPKADTTTAAVN